MTEAGQMLLPENLRNIELPPSLPPPVPEKNGREDGPKCAPLRYVVPDEGEG